PRPSPPLFPSTTLFRSQKRFEQQLLAVTNQHQFEAMQHEIAGVRRKRDVLETEALERMEAEEREAAARPEKAHALERAEAESGADRKSTRLNSSHVKIS